MLTSQATSLVTSREFEEANAFIRAYGVALGFTIPEHVLRVAFPAPEIFAPYQDNATKPDHLFKDLAAILAWRQCVSVFADVERMYSSEDEQRYYKNGLMEICGYMYPASNRADELMREFSKLLNDSVSQDILREDYFIPPGFPFITLYFMMINDCLEGPDISFKGAIVQDRILAMSDYAGQTLLEVVDYFKKRGSDIYLAHRAQGQT